MAATPRSAPRSPNLLDAAGFTCTASTTSTTPAGRWTSSPPACGCATSSASASSSRSRATATAATTCTRSPTSSSRGRDARWCGPRPRCSATCRRTRPPATRTRYIDAVIARAKALLGDDGFAQRLRPRARRDPGRHPPGPRGIRRPLRRVVLRAQPRRPTAPSTARSSGCAATASSTRRTARSGSAPPTSATRRTASWCARTA